MKTRLSVNLNAVAFLRNRRTVGWPNLLEIADLVLRAGASGITVHPRPDQRHIRTTDLFELSNFLRDRYPIAELCMEGFPNEDFLSLVKQAQPDQVTLVPDDPGQSTSDHGWDFRAQSEFLRSRLSVCKDAGFRLSLFVDPDPTAPPFASELGADRVELYTGPFGALMTKEERAPELARLKASAESARAVGLEINAGHDLTLENLPELKAAIPYISEVSIGHGITADALKMGFPQAVKTYLARL